MAVLHLGKEWLPDERRYLREYEHECMQHIEKNTFEEEPFVRYFSTWDEYIDILMRFPEEKDWYDADNLPKIAEYYNEHTRTNNRYTNYGKKYEESTSSYSSSYSSSNSSSSDSPSTFLGLGGKDWAVIGGATILFLLLLRSCSHAEAVDFKEYIEEENNDKIIWEDPTYTPYDINSEVIRPGDFPAKVKKLIK